MQTAGWLREGIDGESVARSAAARNVEVTPLSRYAREARPRDGLQLGFAAVDAREIRAAYAIWPRRWSERDWERPFLVVLYFGRHVNVQKWCDVKAPRIP
jgi:DNA-binding transcriptional MocR family regulator